MAIINYSPWQDAAQAAQGVSNNLSQVFLQLPVLRAQLAYQAARIGLDREKHTAELPLIEAQTRAQGAHAGYYDAAAKAATAKSAREDQEAQIPAMAGDAVATAMYGSPMQQLAQGPTREAGQANSMADAVRYLTQVAAANPQQGQQAVEQFLATQQSGLQSNPQLAQMKLLGDKLFSNVPAGATMANQLTGQQVMTAPPNPSAPQNSFSGLAGLLNIANLINQGGPLEQTLMQLAQQQAQAAMGTNAPRVILPKWDPATRRVIRPGGTP